MTGRPLTYSVVVVTRNRPDILRIALPTHLRQAQRPERIVVVDASDNPGPNEQLVSSLGAESGAWIRHVRASAGIPAQRNEGLTWIDSDVVMFADDDSIVFPGTHDRVMEVYSSDTSARYGGVCAFEALAPPSGLFEPEAAVRHRGVKEVLRQKVAPLLRFNEERLAPPDPMKCVARRLAECLPADGPGLDTGEVKPVEWMTGFRMSFRTNLIRDIGFNERLVRYALYEDVDACLAVLERGSHLVAARNALVYHHRAPDRRTGGYEMGVLLLLNRAYVALRHEETSPRLTREIDRYAAYRIKQLRFVARHPYSRERLRGAQAAQKILPDLMYASTDDLDVIYLDLRRRLLDSATPC